MSYRFILLLATWLSCSSVTILASLSERAVAVGTLAAQSENSREPVYGDEQRLTMGDRPSPGEIALGLSPLLAQTSSSVEMLTVGSKGERVRELQALLQQMGYDITPDGNFGEKTRLAVIDFQRKKGLPADGQAGKETFELLEEGFTDTLTDLTGIPTGAPSPNLEPTVPDNSASIPATDATPAPEAMTSDTLTPTVPSVAVEASPTASEPSINVRWIGLGIGVFLIVAALLGAIAYYLRGRQKADAFSPPTLKPADQPWETPPTLSQASLEPVADETPIVQTEAAADSETRNGYTQSANGYAKNAHSSYSYAAIPSADIPRLQKVDIGEELIKDLQSPDPTRRRKAIWDLGQHGDSRAVQPLVELMIDSDSSQRNLILAALSEIGMRTMKPMNRALMISLEDENSDVRKNAIRDVTRVYEQIAQITSILRHAIDDRDHEVKQTAHWALNQINRIRALPESDSAAGLNEPSYSKDSVQHDPSSTPQ